MFAFGNKNFRCLQKVHPTVLKKSFNALVALYNQKDIIDEENEQENLLS